MDGWMDGWMDEGMDLFHWLVGGWVGGWVGWAFRPSDSTAATLASASSIPSCHLTNIQTKTPQIQAIARGLYALVPRDTLLLLTWRELETLVCGSPTFDLAFWRRHTTYSGYTEEVRGLCVLGKWMGRVSSSLSTHRSINGSHLIPTPTPLYPTKPTGRDGAALLEGAGLPLAGGAERLRALCLGPLPPPAQARMVQGHAGPCARRFTCLHTYFLRTLSLQPAPLPFSSSDHNHTPYTHTASKQISRRNTGEDSLPASHTCFFSIELPPYKTEAAMRKGLLTAIHYGMVGILNT